MGITLLMIIYTFAIPNRIISALKVVFGSESMDIIRTKSPGCPEDKN
jgi:hypothetical protein